MAPELNCLTLRVAVPDPPQVGAMVQVRPLVDGRDLLAEAFDKGPGKDPGELLFPGGPLEATGDPHEALLAEASCTEECCGALRVTIRRDGGVVVWDGWRDPVGDEVDLPEFRFDAEQYRIELERAIADRTWEWRARTVARLLEEMLRARTDWLTRWECELAGVYATAWEPEWIQVWVFHPGRYAIAEGVPWLQFQLEFPVRGPGGAAEQAERLERRITEKDPREVGEVCGGSRESAERLGYPWPDFRREPKKPWPKRRRNTPRRRR